MSAPHRRRRPGAAVGSLVTLLVLVGLLTLGGERGGDPAGRPEALDRRHAHPSAPVLDRRSADGADRAWARALPDAPPVPPVPVVAAALVALGLAALAAPRPGPARPLPVRAGRGPPRRTR